jgi:hypothetical protein
VPRVAALRAAIAGCIRGIVTYADATLDTEGNITLKWNCANRRVRFGSAARKTAATALRAAA